MFTPLVLFLGLTVATAVIAYWSDNLGKKLGKKRVSLFGLRPRTTATVLTITSSWAIMLFTLAALLIAVAPLRNALFRYDAERAEYNRDRAQFLRDNANAQRLLASRQEKLSATQESLSNATSQLTANAKQLGKANIELRQANSAVTSARKQVKSAVAGAKAAQNRARAAQQSEAQAKRGERQAEQAQNKAQQELNNSRASLRQIQQRFDATQSRLSVAQSRLAALNSRLALVQSRLATATTKYKRAVDISLNTGRTVLALGRQAIALQRESIALQRQRDELQKQVSGLAGAAQFYREAALQLTGGNVKFPVGRLFASRTIDAGQRPEAIAFILREIFEQGEKGFQLSEDTQTLYANGARLQLVALPEKSGDVYEGDQIYTRLAREIAAANGATSVRLVAAANFTAEEKLIAVRFVTVPVAVAFRSGETIASAVIDGSLGDAVIFSNLLNLTEEGRRVAVSRKVDPPQSPYEPTFYELRTTNVNLFQALRRIEAGKRPVRVNLVAAGELSTVEPLRVRFEIEETPNNS